jgi:hypothetical protein
MPYSVKRLRRPTDVLILLQKISEANQKKQEEEKKKEERWAPLYILGGIGLGILLLIAKVKELQQK